MKTNFRVLLVGSAFSFIFASCKSSEDLSYSVASVGDAEAINETHWRYNDADFPDGSSKYVADYFGAGGRIQPGPLWEVVEDRVGCHKSNDGTSKVLKTYTKGQVFSVNHGRGGSDEVFYNSRDAEGRTWMAVLDFSLGDGANTCYVEASKNAIQPFDGQWKRNDGSLKREGMPSARRVYWGAAWKVVSAESLPCFFGEVSEEGGFVKGDQIATFATGSDIWPYHFRGGSDSVLFNVERGGKYYMTTTTDFSGSTKACYVEASYEKIRPYLVNLSSN